MTATNDLVEEPAARFFVVFDTPSDIVAFERHYNDVHMPMAKQLPGLRRYTRSHRPTPVVGDPSYLVVMLDWDNMAALEAAFASEVGQRTAEDAENLKRFATMRGMIIRLNEV
ncbi:EthD family reductase [Paenarthrobacter sp. PH39-S1]|uniref:EthD family reductase n=1 Tax=Paenarthrobacter sp. PH39-S1 TaxID=3046204 RepID=UPI0024BBC6DB|nr:EthD family reductase [Paenarthrobacter sp. PH39-S1]MDJ0356675.1 EthD family reductase [Paenarthrobacter sp. PH39-S1]